MTVKENDAEIPRKKSDFSPKIDDITQIIKSKQSLTSTIGLKREIGLFSAVCLIVSVMIGSGIFISPSSVLKKSGSVGLCLVVWAVCGLISYLGALAFAELGTVVPQSGAEYAYFRAAFHHLHKFWGPLPGFLYIWVIVIIVRPAEVAILVLTFSDYIYKPILDQLDYNLHHEHEIWLEKLIGLLGLGMCLITYINFRSVKLYVKIQNMFSSLKIVACFVVIGGGIYYLAIGETENIKTGFDNTKTSIANLALAFYSGLWAYDGWTSVTVVTEEIKSPHLNIPRSISIGVPLITALYFFMNVAYMSVLTVPEMVAAPAVAIVFAEKILGPVAFLIPIAVVLSTFGCALSVQFGVSRLCYVSGRVGHMVKSLSYIHVRRYTPAPAVVLQGLLSSLFILSGSIIELIEFVGFLIWIFYGLAMVALLVLRKTQPKTPRPYKVPIFIPYCVIVISIYLAVVPLILTPSIHFLSAVAFIVLGIIIYYPLIYKNKHPKFMGKFTYFIQVLFEVVPPKNSTENDKC